MANNSRDKRSNQLRDGNGFWRTIAGWTAIGRVEFGPAPNNKSKWRLRLSVGPATPFLSFRGFCLAAQVKRSPWWPELPAPSMNERRLFQKWMDPNGTFTFCHLKAFHQEREPVRNVRQLFHDRAEWCHSESQTRRRWIWIRWKCAPFRWRKLFHF